MQKATAKQKLARKMRTRKELKRGISIFVTDNWNDRKWARECKLENAINKAHRLKAARKIRMTPVAYG